jgi:hypothetical protein
VRGRREKRSTGREEGRPVLSGRVFYRYVSEEEVRVIEQTGMLRGGRGAGVDATFFTEDIYATAGEGAALAASCA